MCRAGYNTPILIIALCYFISQNALAAAGDSHGWSLDGTRLGTKIVRVIAARGKPDRTIGNIYYWYNAAGGTVEVETDRRGEVAEVSVEGGPREIRTVLLPAAPPQTVAVLGQSGHVNYVPPPGAISLGEELCIELGLRPGKPCEVYRLPGGAILLLNFGNDAGLSDGLLDEVILAGPRYFSAPVP